MLPKDQLEHGAYYYGTCRNACIARWNTEANLFIHWRGKIDTVYPETIDYWAEARPGRRHLDEFRPISKMATPPFEIPLSEAEFTLAGGSIWGRS